MPVFFRAGCSDPEATETTRQAADAVHEVQQKGTHLPEMNGHPFHAISVNILSLP